MTIEIRLLNDQYFWAISCLNLKHVGHITFSSFLVIFMSPNYKSLKCWRDDSSCVWY